ncbi:MAG: DUF402 domain-containing protein [Anaerolineae bacterium]|nr:MAG: DUF402 domain-containing protein [Anaerolineae bacterium]
MSSFRRMGIACVWRTIWSFTSRARRNEGRRSRCVCRAGRCSVCPMDDVRVLKRNLRGEVTWQYAGRILRREPNAVVLEAHFNLPDMPFLDTTLKRGDRFVETFYTDRWYNVFEIHDRDDDRLKGWYCNIGLPAVVDGDTVSYVDLALDLWVSPEGEQRVLDEDEFAALPLDETTRRRAREALTELQAAFLSGWRPPTAMGEA